MPKVGSNKWRWDSLLLYNATHWLWRCLADSYSLWRTPACTKWWSKVNRCLRQVRQQPLILLEDARQHPSRAHTQWEEMTAILKFLEDCDAGTRI